MGQRYVGSGLGSETLPVIGYFTFLLPDSLPNRLLASIFRTGLANNWPISVKDDPWHQKSAEAGYRLSCSV